MPDPDGDALLVPGDRIVLGQVDNDGYYLLGMKHPHSRLFADIACSTNGVAAATLARATALDLDVAALPTWFDVEDAATLNPSSQARITAIAPATNACIERNGLHGRMSLAAQ